MNITQATKQLAAVNARERNLDADALATANKVYTAFRRRFAGADVVVEIHGGAVPNGYGYTAKSTWATRTASGFEVSRDFALKRPNGKAWTVRVTVTGADKKEIAGYTCRRSGDSVVYHA